MLDPRIQFALDEARKLRAEHGEPETIDLSIYSSEESLRKAGITEMSLGEHDELIQQTRQVLEADGFTVKIHEVPTE